MDEQPPMGMFVREDGVEPTNNTAERALRPAVECASSALGCRARPAHYMERTLTVIRGL